jgi:ABC-type nitrate/sulfonate/bicarbonate transport system ATPase subunit
MRPVISFKGLSKSFLDEQGRSLVALKNVNLEVFEGEFLVVIGPSGCGKSTLLRLASGLEKDYFGKILFASDIKEGDMSFVFQHFALLPWLTVFQNVELPLIARKIKKEERERMVAREIQSLALDSFANSYPRQLSGGMRQRVGIARALVTNPKIIFMDEPFSELDSFTAQQLRKELLSIWEKRKMTIIMVTHQIEEALELADRIAVMSPRPGTIEKVVENRLGRPRDKRSKEFFALEDRLYTLIKP